MNKIIFAMLCLWEIIKVGLLFWFFSIENIPFFVIGGIGLVISIILWLLPKNWDICFIVTILCGLFAIITYGNLSCLIDISQLGYCTAVFAGTSYPIAIAIMKLYEAIAQSVDYRTV